MSRFISNLLPALVPVMYRYAVRRLQNNPGEDNDANAASSPQEAYEKRLHDIYHIVFLLRQKLVADVVPAIIQYAGLLVEQSSTRRFDPEVRVQQRNTPRYLTVSPAIRCHARTRVPVRKVVFEIDSHDQGWATDHNGSWTWFDAEIWRSNSEGQRKTTGRREIVRNIVAEWEFTHHLIEWRADDPDEEVAAWVKGLRVGDRINVMAMAQYPGWQNFVRAVKVSVHTVAVI